jgi:RNA polymerase sigma factor for flagellar operon FliA
MATSLAPTYQHLSSPKSRRLPRHSDWREDIRFQSSIVPPIRITGKSTIRLQREAKQACLSRQVEDRQKQVVEMLPLVKRMALKIRERLPAHVEMDDLLANGVLGLVDAVAKFDASKGVKLESYARHRIRGGILDGLRGADPASRDLRHKNKTIQKLYRDLEVMLGRPVKDEEIAGALGMDLGQWHRALNEIQTVGFGCGGRTLSAGPTSKSVGRRIELALLADDAADPFDLCYRREQREILGRALSRLREREREIITLYYQQGLTMKQIADHMKVDESRVSQLHSAALGRLKAIVDCLSHPRHAGIPQPTDTLAMAAGTGAP